MTARSRRPRRGAGRARDGRRGGCPDGGGRADGRHLGTSSSRGVAPVQGVEPGRDGLEPVAGAQDVAGGERVDTAPAVAQVAVPLDDLVGAGADVEEPAGLLLDAGEHLFGGGVPGDEDRRAGRDRLHRRHAERLVPARVDEEVVRPEHGRHLRRRDDVQDAHGVGDAELRGQRERLGSLGPVAEQAELEVGLLLPAAREGGDQAQRAPSGRSACRCRASAAAGRAWRSGAGCRRSRRGCRRRAACRRGAGRPRGSGRAARR